MSFAWALEVAREDGTVACRTPLLPDWETASLWVRFEGIRRGALPPLLTSAPGDATPLWDATRGAPYVAAVRLSIRPPGHATGTPVHGEVPLACLAGQIAEVLRVLVAAGKLVQGELVQPRVCAHPVHDERDDHAGAACGGIAVEELPRELRLVDTPIERFARAATARDLDPADGDVPVFLPAEVLGEAEDLARAVDEVETGGFLLGRLHRDGARPECFVEVTAQIAARHTIAERTRLTFTPETWAAAAAEIAARGRDEELVGWWHKHPFFCARCPLERRQECRLDSAFFSADDVRLHALCFRQAHQVALLLSANERAALKRSLFGWRRGVVAARGFYETGGAHERAVDQEVTS